MCSKDFGIWEEQWGLFGCRMIISGGFCWKIFGWFCSWRALPYLIFLFWNWRLKLEFHKGLFGSAENVKNARIHFWASETQVKTSIAQWCSGRDDFFMEVAAHWCFVLHFGRSWAVFTSTIGPINALTCADVILRQVTRVNLSRFCLHVFKGCPTTIN